MRVNREGIEIKPGMKVKGYILILRALSYGRVEYIDKDIEGIVVNRNGKLYVNSFKEPNKNYPLRMFAHDSMTHNSRDRDCPTKPLYLEILNNE